MDLSLGLYTRALTVWVDKSWGSNGKMRGDWVADLGGVSRHIAGLLENI